MPKLDEKRIKELSNAVAGIGKGSSPTKKQLPLSQYYVPKADTSKLDDHEMRIVALETEEDGEIELDSQAVLDIIKNAKGNDRIDISHIRNGENLALAAQKAANGGFDMNDMRWHGGGSTSGSSVVFVTNEIVPGSGTTFTLMNTPTSGTVAVYALGQRLTPGAGNDYTISGSIITTAGSWSAGQILSDYHM